MVITGTAKRCWPAQAKAVPDARDMATRTAPATSAVQCRLTIKIFVKRKKNFVGTMET